MRVAVLLRGVNVGGNNRLPMAEWRKVLAGQGFDRVQTYIQSGNAVLDSALSLQATEALIAKGISATFGISTPVFVLEAGDLQAALDALVPQDDLAKTHAFFCAEDQPALDEAAMQALAAPGDTWHLLPRCLLLHTPAGIGRSALAAKLPKFIKGAHTARNLRSVAAVLALMQEEQE
jgi:uncharacterized protein (DUF1697 family)